jgi:RimJ/RimL family protein N-acetyltransferase
MKIPTLETERLFVRPLRAADLEEVRRLYARLADADLGHPPITEPEHVRDWLAWSALGYEQLARLHQPPYGDRAVVLKGTSELVGLVGNVPALAPFGLIPGLREGKATKLVVPCDQPLRWALSSR